VSLLRLLDAASELREQVELEVGLLHPYSLTPSLYHSYTVSLSHSLTPTLSHSLTPTLSPSLLHCITPSLYHSSTVSLLHCITPPLTHSPIIVTASPQDITRNLASLTASARVCQYEIRPKESTPIYFMNEKEYLNIII
jgi:hypothetical protein